MTNPNLRNDKQTPKNLKHSVNSGKIERGGDCTYSITNMTEEAQSQRTKVFFSLKQGTKVEVKIKLFESVREVRRHQIRTVDVSDVYASKNGHFTQRRFKTRAKPTLWQNVLSLTLPLHLIISSSPCSARLKAGGCVLVSMFGVRSDQSMPGT